MGNGKVGLYSRGTLFPARVLDGKMPGHDLIEFSRNLKS